MLVAEYADVISSVAAIARSFPLFSLKTKDNELKNIDINVVLADGKVIFIYLLSLIKTLDSCWEWRQLLESFDQID